MNKFYEALSEVIADFCVNNDRWITIHPHGEDSEDYRRLKLEDGESPKEAIDRVYKKDEDNKTNKDNKVAEFIKKRDELSKQYTQKAKYYNRNYRKFNSTEREQRKAEIENITKEYFKLKDEEEKYIKDNSGAYPQNAKIAGVKKEAPMDFEKANSNNVNPKYSRDSYEYSHNCQSSVVAYEARRRGYNVEVVARSLEDKTQQLAEHSSWAFVDKNGEVCEPTEIHSTSSLNLYKKLEQSIKSNERYNFSYTWYRGSNARGHIITIARNEKNEIQLYDSQTSEIYVGKEAVTKYLKYEVSYKNPIKLLRVDDKEFNKYFINDVVKKK